jgi:RTX calcium-binding nonapeptide repeat (4 copies)/Lipase (class 3)
MATTPDLALLALRVYSTPKAADGTNTELNRPAVPTGWVELEWHPDAGGFSYGVYRNGAEIVISYTGTNEGLDWATNGANGFGLGSTQTTKAALVYLQAKQQYGSNITFTGHSLGGGLASIMAVWFDRPAVVFDEAPFEIAARNPLIILATKAALTLAGYDVGAFAGYTGILDFLTRETQVTNHYMEGEALYYLRAAWPTVMGNGQDNPVRANITDMSGLGGPVDLHSQALLTAMLVSDAFRLATYTSSRVIPLFMDKNFYAISTQNTAQENVLIKFIRSEQGTGDILTHFASDLNKLGTNIAGLNVAAQNAITAQGIEWYYWQSTNYPNLPRQEFFIQTANLYQYTTALGDHMEGAKNKAARYVDKWLTPLLNANNAFGGIVNYNQWNVVAGDTGATATALDPSKSQIFVGGGGADTFTGGSQADLILAGAGNDTLSGGAGNDQLYGGAGTDTYLFTAGWGKDTIIDSDGLGSIQLGGTPLGSAQGVGERNQWAFDLGGGQYAGIAVIANSSSSTGFSATIVKGTDTANTITIQNFDFNAARSTSGNGYLGIKLDTTQHVALIQGDGTAVGASSADVYADLSFTDAQLDGKSSNLNERGGRTFHIYLAQAAHAGDTLTLAAGGGLADASYERYVFNSFLRYISLGCRLIKHKNKFCQRAKRIRLRTTISCSEVRV